MSVFWSNPKTLVTNQPTNQSGTYRVIDSHLFFLFLFCGIENFIRMAGSQPSSSYRAHQLRTGQSLLVKESNLIQCRVVPAVGTSGDAALFCSVVAIGLCPCHLKITVLMQVTFFQTLQGLSLLLAALCQHENEKFRLLRLMGKTGWSASPFSTSNTINHLSSMTCLITS